MRGAGRGHDRWWTPSLCSYGIVEIMNLFMMRMIFELELKINLMSPNMMVHFVLLLPLVLVKLTL
jgi:hypothetical protein